MIHRVRWRLLRLSPRLPSGTIDNDALKGQWTLLFTGYTFCPDICPTTLSDLQTYPAPVASSC